MEPSTKPPRHTIECPKCGHTTKTKHQPGEISYCGNCKKPIVVASSPPS